MKVQDGPPREKGNLLFCVTGSIAATGAFSVLQVLVERAIFANVQVAISKSAMEFIQDTPLAVLSRNPCVTDLFDEARKGWPAHADIARNSTLALVAPASGNTMAKLAHGIADGTVTNILNLYSGPCILVPAAHPKTTQRKSFLRNMEVLKGDGFHFCGPVDGYSVSEHRRAANIPAMPRPEVIAAYVEYFARFGEPPDVEFAFPSHDQSEA